ncbi:hypothetical protein PLICRDRAFT_35648 [Plicaturopsis crispa FD-325 SS-3]|nr:hypothetical protein PLICRDRAFT_35648 [Plicaturopsis crispa FD-325 SS-3]
MAPRCMKIFQRKLASVQRTLLRYCCCQRRAARSISDEPCHCIRSTSGPARTHSLLAGTTAARYGPRLSHSDTFLCKDAVDVEKLLNLSRRSLYVDAKDTGGNALVDEQWFCKISHPKFQKQDRYKVSIHYFATVARTSWPDAQRPVEVEAAVGIDGLMTVLDRKDY